MRCLFFLICMVFLSATINAQDFTVIRVKNGTITSSGLIVRERSQLTKGTKIKFSSSATFCIVIDKEKTIWKLKPQGEELLCIVEKSITPCNQMLAKGAISSKTEFANIFKPITNNKLLADTNTFAIIGDTLKIDVPHSIYKMDNEHFFYVKYTYNKSIEKIQLKFEGESLIVDKVGIYEIKGKMIEPQNMTLCYYDMTGAEPVSYAITDFKPIFIDFSEFEEGVELIAKAMKDNSLENISNVEGLVLEAIYGNYYRTNLEENLKKIFILK